MFLVECCLSKGQSSAGLPAGPLLWAGLCVQAAPSKSMPTMQLATEVPVLSYEDTTHFTGFVSTILCASGCESQPLALFTSLMPITQMSIPTAEPFLLLQC